MTKIVISADGSPSAREAIDVGLELATEQGAEVTFVHALPPDEFVRARTTSGRTNQRSRPRRRSVSPGSAACRRAS